MKYALYVYLCDIINKLSMKPKTHSISTPLRLLLLGMGSISNIAGGYFNMRKYIGRSDFNALRNDWRKIGHDMNIAKSIYGKEHASR